MSFAFSPTRCSINSTLPKSTRGNLLIRENFLKWIATALAAPSLIESCTRLPFLVCHLCILLLFMYHFNCWSTFL